MIQIFEFKCLNIAYRKHIIITLSLSNYYKKFYFKIVLKYGNVGLSVSAVIVYNTESRVIKKRFRLL